jgi:hypothetical protein
LDAGLKEVPEVDAAACADIRRTGLEEGGSPLRLEVEVGGRRLGRD